MKNTRTRAAVFVLCGLLIMIAVSYFTVQRTCTLLLERTDAAAEAAASGGDASAEIGALEDAWETCTFRLRLFVPRQRLTDLNDSVSRLRPMYETDSDEFQAELAALKADLRWIRQESHSVF